MRPQARFVVQKIGLLVGLMAVAGALVWATSRPTAEVRAIPPLSLPSGFVDELVVGDLLSPRAFAFAPDGRIFILERGSAASNDQNLASVRVFKNGTLLTTRALTLFTCGDSERGLLGMALDPNFASNGYVYLYYTRQALSGSSCSYNYHPDATGNVGPRNRVSRYTLTGDVIDPASERVLIDGIITNVGYHNAGDLHFGADGYLYISTGDGGVSSLSPVTDTLNGKILRILPQANGTYTTTGNPFNTAPGARLCGTATVTYGNGACKEVYAYGFRNPFRFSIKPGTNTLYVGDVGGGVWEELDEVTTGGGNYGWPVREGPCPNGAQCNPATSLPSGYADPIYWYLHDAVYANNDSAIIGGAFYTGTVGGPSYPAQYLNGYFLADFVRGFVRQVNQSGNTWSAAVPDFATGGQSLVGLKTGLEGNLYYLSFTDYVNRTNELRRIRYQPSGNQAPYAQASVSPSGSGNPAQVYTFSALGSGDPDNNLPLTYTWAFGDGASAVTTVLTTTHVYTLTGAIPVTLTVTDSGSPPLTSAPVTLTVFPSNTPPTATIALTNTTAPARALYHVNDVWEFGVGATSADVVSATWSIVFHHGAHTHPFMPSPSPGVYTFTTNFDESDPHVWYRVHLTVRDAQGQITSVYRDVLPEVVNLTFTTVPAGGQVTVQSLPYTAPVVISYVVGIHVPVDVPTPQIIGGTAYTFTQWSDGGAQSHTLTTPATNATFTATLTGPTLFLPSIFAIGPGGTDHIPHQIVRTADDRVYIFVNQQYSPLLRAYWTTTPGLPNSATDFSGFAQISESGLPISVDAVYDGARFIHLLVNTNAGALKDYVFDTTTDSFLSPLTLTTGLPTVSGDYVGTTGLSGLFDASGALNLAYWSAGQHITHAAYTYTAASHTLNLVAPAVQVDTAGNANHPALALSPLDGSLTIAWVSQATNPAQILARTHSAGAWGAVETVSTAPVWTSANFGINIDQGPSLLIGPDGLRHLIYIQNWDASNQYGRVHYAARNGAGWTDTALNIYSHNPVLAINDSGQLFMIAHGHPLNPGPACLSMDDMCLLRRNSDGAWAAPELLIARYNAESFDTSPSVKWSVVGFNRADVIEAAISSVANLQYNEPTMYYVRLSQSTSPATPTPTSTTPAAASATPTATPIGPTSTPTATATRTRTPTPSATPAVSGLITLTVPIAASADDANEVNGALDLTSGTLWLGTGGSATASYAGLRFTNLSLPAGATIASARLEVYSSQSQWANTGYLMAAEASGNSAAFSSTARPSQRALTAQQVNHTSNVQWQANTWYSLNEIGPVIQEVVNRADWQSGNSLSIILKGTVGTWGRKFVSSVNGSTANAARLIVSYASGAPAPTATATATRTATLAPTNTPTSTATRTVTLTATLTPLATNTPTSTTTRTATPTASLTPLGTNTATATATQTVTPAPTSTATAISGPTNTATRTPTSTVTSTATATRTPTRTLTATRTRTPTRTATVTRTVTATPTATHLPGTFPATGVLDSFNRTNGGVGANWSGQTGGYAIASNQLDVSSGGDLYWSATQFGPNQEAYVTLSSVAAGTEQDLLLKAQSNTGWTSGVIEVLYEASTQRVQVWTYASGQGWVQRGADIPVTLINGDILGARAKADGTVEVYRNGALLTTRSVTGWPYATNGGYIGLWFINAGAALLDNFGGGNAP